MALVQEEEVEEKEVTPATLTLCDKQWYYKGEGNVNVVLAVPADGTVVRVMKDDGGDGSAAGAAAALSALVRYRDAVGRLFFAGCDYTDVPAPMAVSADELRDVDRRVQRDRPPHRRHKSLRWAGGLVAVCPDYTVLLPTRPARVYCFELKPKQGWLHVDDRADRDGWPGVRCAFCAHQWLKLARGDVRALSRYCPLDLFSGRRPRVRRAIRRLFHAPQNNLKVFADGVPADGRDFVRVACEAFGDVRRLCAFVAAVLLGRGYDEDVRPATAGDEDAWRATEDDDDEDPRPEDESPGAGRPPCDFDAVPMPQHCVLHKILAMQKMQTSGFAAVCSEYKRSWCAEQFGHVARLSAAAGPESVSSPVDGYLVAATAHDCSVFVTFSQVKRNYAGQRKHTVQFDGLCYEICIKVSDLDPKPLSTVEKHRKRNANVLLACKQYSLQGYNV